MKLRLIASILVISFANYALYAMEAQKTEDKTESKAANQKNNPFIMCGHSETNYYSTVIDKPGVASQHGRWLKQQVKSFMPQEVDILRIHNTNATDITVVNRLNQLKSLSIDNNHFKNLTALSCSNITDLSADNCGILSLDFIKNLPKLIRLSLRRNAVSDISALKDRYTLYTVHLAHNQISDPSPLIESELSCCSVICNVKEISLEGNPLEKQQLDCIINYLKQHSNRAKNQLIVLMGLLKIRVDQSATALKAQAEKALALAQEKEKITTEIERLTKTNSVLRYY
jgi:hypothetical protein